MTSHQIPLFFETYEAAIRSAVDGMGGLKAVGHMLWPSMEPEDANRKLSACLNPEKREKLELNELRLIRREARQRGIHVLAAYEMRDSGYADPVAIEREDEQAKLMREFVEAKRYFQALHQRMQHVGLEVAS